MATIESIRAARRAQAQAHHAAIRAARGDTDGTATPARAGTTRAAR